MLQQTRRYLFVSFLLVIRIMKQFRQRKAGHAPSLYDISTSESVVRSGFYFAIGAVAIGLVFWKLQFSTPAICCVDWDGYYHIKWSQLFWEGIKGGQFPPAFTWLPLTTLNPEDYADQHLLFHILQIPFTWFGDLRLGAKVATTLFASLALFSCYSLIVRYRINYPLVWLIALLSCSMGFLLRMSAAKAMGVSIVLMVTGAYLLFERKYKWLAPLAFLYVWTYNLYVLLCAAAVIWLCVIWRTERRLEWRPVLWTAVGTLAGFVINPYFPKNVMLFIEHLLIKIRVGTFPTVVGSEWYPYDTWFFLRSCLVACVAMLVGYLAFGSIDRKHATRPLFFLIFSTLLLVATSRSQRFVEYWPPFAILFAAFTLQPIFDGMHTSIGRLPSDVLADLHPFPATHEPAEVIGNKPRTQLWKTGVAVCIVIALSIILFANFRKAAEMISRSTGVDDFRPGMEWIRTNVPPGQMVFNSNWDDFPGMFYLNPDHRYVSGLDPTYLLDKNPDLAELYGNIVKGDEKDPAPIIRDRFGTSYVFYDKAQAKEEFLTNAIASGRFEKVYEDEYSLVLHIAEQNAGGQ